jgi:tetratricopeptide (TPR) repeat protein
MFRYIFVSCLLIFVSSVATLRAQGQDEVTDALDHARALYYEANFDESIQLLSRVDDVLRPRTDRLPDKINVKLQLALAYIGLNNNERASSFLREVYALDPDYKMDPQQFSPKVIALADEAKAAQEAVRCQTVRDNAHRQLESKSLAPLMSTLDSMKPKCTGLTELEAPAAELFYKAGLESYRAGNFADALQKFRSATRLAPQHELANQYVELTQSKLEVTTDRLAMSWQRNFAAKEYRLAADDFNQLKSFSDSASVEMRNQARTEYRRLVSELVETSNKACAKNDTATVAAIRDQIAEILPDPSIGEDILAQMASCTRRECLNMVSTLMLPRLKVKVDPEIPAGLQAFLRQTPLTIKVQTRIDEKGDVVAKEATGGNPALQQAIRAAVAQWKFTPVLDQNGPRCVETELPIVITP